MHSSRVGSDNNPGSPPRGYVRRQRFDSLCAGRSHSAIPAHEDSRFRLARRAHRVRNRMQQPRSSEDRVRRGDHRTAFSARGRRASVVYDVSNPQYTEEFASGLRSEFEARGGAITMSHPFDSTGEPDYLGIADQIVGDDGSAVVFIASGIDTVVLAQQLWKRNVEKALYAAEWAKTSDIVSVGGRAVDGMVIASQFFPDEPTQEYERFSRRYQVRYGSSPDFAAQYAYETAMILLDAIERAGTTELQAFKRQIVGRTHQGLVEPITIDSYGEATRTPAFTVIQDGRFIVEKLDIENE